MRARSTPISIFIFQSLSTPYINLASPSKFPIPLVFFTQIHHSTISYLSTQSRHSIVPFQPPYMAEREDAHLNGAYYGPSVPPSKSYHRPSRGGGLLGCCCSCVFGLVFKLILAAVVFMGLAFLVFWLIVRPTKVKFHVTDATLTQFNFSTESNLHYNLALNLTIRNPNKKIGIYYDRIEARALYEGQRLSTVTLVPFYQGHKTTNVLNPVFQGQQLIVGSDLLEEFNEQNSAGIYEIEMKLYLRVRFRLGKIKTGKFKPRIECDLKVPLSQNGNLVGTFQTEKCSVDYFNYR